MRPVAVAFNEVRHLLCKPQNAYPERACVFGSRIMVPSSTSSSHDTPTGTDCVQPRMTGEVVLHLNTRDPLKSYLHPALAYRNEGVAATRSTCNWP